MVLRVIMQLVAVALFFELLAPWTLGNVESKSTMLDI